jgi:hypothetical protein
MKAKKYWRKDWRQENLDLYNGDHWDFWIGPKVDENEPNAQEFNAAIERVFQTNNLIRNCIDRHVRALIGRFPNWFFKDASGDRVETEPEEGDEAAPNSAATEAELLIQRWIDRIQSLSQTQEADMGDPFKKAVKDLAVTDTAYLRIWTPEKFKEAKDPIRRVAIHSPDIGAIEFIYDKDKFLEKIYYRYQVDNVDYIESQSIDEATGETVIQTLDSNEKQLLDDEEIRLNLGGRYTVYKMSAPSLITQSARDAQSAANFVLTMLMRNLEQAGFLERIILGAQPPGHWDDVNGVKTFVPDNNFKIGVGQTAFIQGTPNFDAEDNITGYSNPSVNYREPVNVETFERSHVLATSIIYHQMGQGHLLATDLNMSGIARVQSRQDFDTTLEEHRNTVQSAIGGILGAALMLMVDNPEAYEGLDVAVQLRLSTSKPLPEELEQNRKDFEGGLKARTTAMSATGIEDPDAEQQLRKAEAMEDNALAIASTLTTLGMQDNESAIAMLERLGIVPQGTRATVDPNLPLNPDNNGTTAAGNN